ncbi:hypothetical protein K438DRAFT_1704971 [Mycena galopus ATCC 62051]|nr:hypothetical protein K438DRAFT_1704971 [Mycena galopus ATCC 62051]
MRDLGRIFYASWLDGARCGFYTCFARWNYARVALEGCFLYTNCLRISYFCKALVLYYFCDKVTRLLVSFPSPLLHRFSRPHMSVHSGVEKKGHVCPPSNATHPSGRWESLFVYSFITKFTNLRTKIEGLETPMDFEEALLSQEPNTILTQLLARFILNLRPQTRNLSIDQISTTVATVLSEYLKSSERTIFWDDQLKINKDPFEGLEGGFFTADWDFKASCTPLLFPLRALTSPFFRVHQLKILRQLVELQLCHTPEIKNTIDRAWGVSQNKHKKKDAASAVPEPTDPKSQGQLQLVPIGQDSRKKRFWAADDSPRLYVSTNPWKMAATFQTVSSTREEYLGVIEELKASAPPELKKGEKRPKMEQSHLTLIETLEGRIETIDTELLRVEKARKRLEQKQAALARAAQAEIRETRTRRQTRKPDYVYTNTFDDEEANEYTYQDAEANDEDDDDFLNFRDESEGPSTRRASSSTGQRRSTRTAVLNANGKREAQEEPWTQWRGERRSTRLGAPPDTQLDLEPRNKRARTEDSTVSTGSVDAVSTISHGAKNGVKLKNSGAAALKPNEVAMEQIAGKKRSKFWVYAVEPINGGDTVAPDPDPMDGRASSAGDSHMSETVVGKTRSWEYPAEPTNGAERAVPSDSDPMNGGGASSVGDSEANGRGSDMEMDSPSPGPGNGNGRGLDGGSASPLNS